MSGHNALRIARYSISGYVIRVVVRRHAVKKDGHWEALDIARSVDQGSRSCERRDGEWVRREPLERIGIIILFPNNAKPSDIMPLLA
jgi:hypothetical protein